MSFGSSEGLTTLLRIDTNSISMGWRELGRQIRQLRDNRLTQAQLADRVGVSTIYIRKLEAGERNASFEVLERLAEALDATLRVDLIKRRKGGRRHGG